MRLFSQADPGQNILSTQKLMDLGAINLGDRIGQNPGQQSCQCSKFIRAKQAKRLYPRIKAFAWRTIGKQDAVARQEDVVIAHAFLALGKANRACNINQMLGMHQHGFFGTLALANEHAMQG